MFYLPHLDPNEEILFVFHWSQVPLTLEGLVTCPNFLIIM